MELAIAQFRPLCENRDVHGRNGKSTRESIHQRLGPKDNARAMLSATGARGVGSGMITVSIASLLR